jgi:hypothetical protein
LPLVTEAKDKEALAKDVASLEPTTLSRKADKCLTPRPQVPTYEHRAIKYSSLAKHYLKIQLQSLFLKSIYFMYLLLCAIRKLDYKKLDQFKQLIHSLKPKNTEFHAM